MNLSNLLIPCLTILVVLSCNHSIKNDQNMTSQNNLSPLFEAALQYDNSVNVEVPTTGRTGDFIGSGKGTLTGKIAGEVYWQFFAENCAYLWVKDGEEPPENQHLCKTNPGGIIKTADGAEIRFDAKGYGFRGYDESNPHLWKLTAALQFHTNDERYSWLNTSLGIWEGTFNENEGKAVYRAYLQNQ